MTNFDESVDAFGYVIAAVAADMGRRYGRYGFGSEDAEQVCLLWVFEHPRHLQDYLDDEKGGGRRLARVLRNECTDAGEEHKAQHLGYSRDDLFYYSKTMLSELLPAMFDRAAWLHPEKGDAETEQRRPSVPAEGGNWIATLSDVSRAFDKLDKSDRELLERFHRDGEKNMDMARKCGVSEQTMSDWHSKALRRLVDKLGGPKPRAQHEVCTPEEGEEPCGECCRCTHGWTGGRRALSNAAARRLTSAAWEDE